MEGSRKDSRKDDRGRIRAHSRKDRGRIEPLTGFAEGYVRTRGRIAEGVLNVQILYMPPRTKIHESGGSRGRIAEAFLRVRGYRGIVYTNYDKLLNRFVFRCLLLQS